MDIKKIKTFLKVAELKSFSKAAEHLGLAQSGASKHVQELEAELGFPLFDRSSRRVVLTELGDNLLPTFTRQVLELDQAIQDARLKHQGKVARIRIGYLASACYAFFPKLIQDFHEKFPDIMIELHEGNPAHLIKSLEEGALDLCFSRPAPCSSSLTQFVLHSGRLVIASPKKGKNELPFHNSVYILEMDEGPSSYTSAFVQMEKVGMPTDRVEGVKDYHSAIVLVECGLGYAIMPESVVPLYSNRVDFRYFDDPLTIELVLTYRRGLPFVRQFVQMAKELKLS